MNFKEELARKADNLPMENMQIENEPQENGIYGNAPVKGAFIRPLRANEIECRIAAINEKGLSLLLYKDARVDQRILDETFGSFGWKRSHQSIDGNLYCTVEVYNRECGEWIAKQDVGTVGYTEKEKSQASDSFKRACFNWGIGRELYSAPFIWVPAGKVDIRKKADIHTQKEKFFCNEHFSVSSIEYNEEREIVGLLIVNGKNQTVYELKPTPTAGVRKENVTKGMKRKDTEKQDVAEPKHISAGQMESLKQELQRTGVGLDKVRERYQIDKPEEMSEELYRKVMNALAKTKSVEAA